MAEIYIFLLLNDFPDTLYSAQYNELDPSFGLLIVNF
jgi:hypothetical protein